MESSRNALLWKKAKQRAAFKVHLRTYTIVIGGLWIIYFLTNGSSLFTSWDNWEHRAHPWPIWPMLGWGLGLASHYMSAYKRAGAQDMVRREYDRLLREQR